MTARDILRCDLLVIGAGMAGLSAAGYAAERGARVVVVERASTIGGSAALSGGFLWTATSTARMQLYSGGRFALGALVHRNYATGLDWMRRRDLAMSRSLPVLHGRGYQIDILGHLRDCVNLVEQHDGHVVLDSQVRSLLLGSGGAVAGGRVGDDGNEIDVLAPATILATGGYQNCAELRARYIHPHASQSLLLRSNAMSDGAAIRLAQPVGGYVDGENPGFYGHLVSESPDWGDRRLYTLLAQYHSDRCILLNERGERFCDESVGDHTNTNRVVAEPGAHAICFWDDVVHRIYATEAVVRGAEVVDKMNVALEWGGRGVVANSLQEVGAFADSVGFDGSRLVQSVHEYNAACNSSWESLKPPRSENFGQLARAPFYALVVRPAITHTHGGLAIDERARVLTRSGQPIPGLLAAGADVGDVYGLGYAGGLALALGYAIEAARTAGYG